MSRGNNTTGQGLMVKRALPMSVNAVYFCVYLAGILFETLAEIINRRKRHMFVLRSLNALLFAALWRRLLSAIWI